MKTSGMYKSIVLKHQKLFFVADERDLHKDFILYDFENCQHHLTPCFPFLPRSPRSPLQPQLVVVLSESDSGAAMPGGPFFHRFRDDDDEDDTKERDR